MNETVNASHPRNLSYWDRVALLKVTSDPEYITFILENECADDFREAIAANPHASVENLAWAAEHTSTWVRKTVVANPRTPADILVRILNDSYEAINFHEEEARTVSPMQRYHRMSAEQHAELNGEVLAVLIQRMGSEGVEQA